MPKLTTPLITYVVAYDKAKDNETVGWGETCLTIADEAVGWRETLQKCSISYLYRTRVINIEGVI